MKRNLLLIISLALVIASCSSVDKKVPEIATEICNCFSSLDKQMSPDLKAIFIKAGAADKPQEALGDELLSQEPAKRDSLMKELQTLIIIGDPSSELNKCMNDFKKRYSGGKTKNRDKFYANLFAELEGKPGCQLALAAFKISYKETK